MKICEKRINTFMEHFDLQFVLGYLREHCGQEVEHELELANLLLEQKFLFDDEWDMEPCHIVYELLPMCWSKSPNGDAEWIYMLNRHGFLIKLLHAYWHTGELVYVDKVKFYLFDWIRQNPLEMGGESLRTIDTGIRCANWIPIIAGLWWSGCLNENEEQILLKSMEEQFVYLRSHYIDKYMLSNWGVLQTTAICRGGLWFGSKDECVELEQWAYEELYRQLELQVFRDGSHWEQSLMYHVEVLNACMDLWKDSMDLKQEVKPVLPDTIRRMTGYVQYATAPDRTQPNQGDSDVTGIEGVMEKAVTLWQKGSFKYLSGTHMGNDAVWFRGKPGCQTFHNTEAEEPRAKNMSFPDSGNLFLRSGWGKTDHYTYLHNGSLGSSHGHGDLTHLSTYYNGIPFLIDSGRYTYREDMRERILLKSAQSHNVCVVDKYPLCVPSGSWEYQKFASPMKNYFSESERASCVEMAYTGMIQEKKNCMVKRTVVIVDQGIWLILDDIRCDGTHSHEAYYHLHNQVSAELVNETTAKLSQKAECLNFYSSYKLYSSQMPGSETYNRISMHTCLTGESGKWNDRALEWSIICKAQMKVREGQVYQAGSEVSLGENEVLVKEFWEEEQLLCSIVIFHGETYSGTKLHRYRHRLFHGKVVAFDNSENKMVAVLLKT